jgi:molybdopterin biosynthesis enzyme
MTLSKANCLIAISEKEEKINSGDLVNIIKLNMDKP